MREMERAFERLLFASRWILAPVYLGLAVVALVLLVVFLRELAGLIPEIVRIEVDQMIVVALKLIDLALIGNLLMIVVLSGYENFVSRLDAGDEADRPYWLGKVDFGGIKIKLMGSIVAISAIQLLKRFMELADGGKAAVAGKAPPTETELFWLTAIHLAFVVSALLLALSDWFHSRTKE